MDFNSQNSEKTLRVGIIGPKRVGKDHFRNAVFPDFLRASIGDVLKELSVSPEYEGTMGHDSRYLEKDFAQCLENPELLARVAAILAKDGLPEGFAISWSSFDTKESRQALMDAYKNFPEELRTRKALQHFWNVVKRTESADFFTRRFLEDTADLPMVACTDVRFLVEVVDFALVGFPFVTLNHRNAEERYVGTEHLEHTSEFELALSVSEYGHIGLLADITGHEDSPFPRLSVEETVEVGKAARKLAEGFAGYPDDVMETLARYKRELLAREGEFWKYGMYEDGYGMEWEKKMAGGKYSEAAMRMCFEKLMEARGMLSALLAPSHR